MKTGYLLLVTRKRESTLSSSENSTSNSSISSDENNLQWVQLNKYFLCNSTKA